MYGTNTLVNVFRLYIRWFPFPEKLLTFKLGVAPSQDSSDHQEYDILGNPELNLHLPLLNPAFGATSNILAASLPSCRNRNDQDSRCQRENSPNASHRRASLILTRHEGSKRPGRRLDQWIQGALQLVRHSPHRTLGKNFQQKQKSGKCHSS